mmetsp:Transcript_17598/g.59419  ORF Transcript_17598/g.59419 Transcript_17598/m.59419 type:complete len:384 (+) Transcript_17598:934-2085(+)
MAAQAARPAPPQLYRPPQSYPPDQQLQMQAQLLSFSGAQQQQTHAAVLALAVSLEKLHQKVDGNADGRRASEDDSVHLERRLVALLGDYRNLRVEAQSREGRQAGLEAKVGELREKNASLLDEKLLLLEKQAASLANAVDAAAKLQEAVEGRQKAEAEALEARKASAMTHGMFKEVSRLNEEATENLEEAKAAAKRAEAACEAAERRDEGNQREALCVIDDPAAAHADATSAHARADDAEKRAEALEVQLAAAQAALPGGPPRDGVDTADAAAPSACAAVAADVSALRIANAALLEKVAFLEAARCGAVQPDAAPPEPETADAPQVTADAALRDPPGVRALMQDVYKNLYEHFCGGAEGETFTAAQIDRAVRVVLKNVNARHA